MKNIVALFSAFVIAATSYMPAATASSVVGSAPIVPIVGDAPAVPAAGVFPILPFEPDEDAVPQLLPIASNHALGEANSKITRAVIIIHDVTRDANGVAAMLATLAGPANKSTLILAPQFMLASDIARFRGRLPQGLAHWPLGAWEDGGESLAQAPQKGISSFTAIDLLILYLNDKRVFPSLKDIVIAGHGAGANFAMRYAALGQAPDLLDANKTKVRFVVANASSYLYFTSMRPSAGKQGFALPDAKACPRYNDYHYGLSHLNAYGQRGGLDDIRLRYPSRRVIILVGSKEGAEDDAPDTNCAAILQGSSRLARAANYDAYLTTIFGSDAEMTQSFASITGAGIDAVAVFNSPCGMSALFGNGICEPPPVFGAVQ